MARPAILAALALLPLLATASCMAGGRDAPSTAQVAPQASVPVATYGCSDGGLVKIENAGASLNIVGPDGESTAYAASPPGQRRTYGRTAATIVIDGNEALFIRNGKVEVTCTH